MALLELLVGPQDNIDSAYFAIADDTATEQLLTNGIAGDVTACRRRPADRVSALGVGRVLLMPEGSGSREATLRTIREAGQVFT